ncbi:MFS transporter [Sphingobacterium sp. UT-1RO-CII-1]|uniref:MFS transporter n=1 Tax=Sphingobacterium sp. UT-1RO-CII-1 TaxID=2995225 RepID=UPI00227D63E9|nr:MFS transporter [Sphingobacterium sp. UT-1RO-CII-1]MCY4780583.1 MFS transporter [Sphingobacterium sp. UT-1RO-CII-1]
MENRKWVQTYVFIWSGQFISMVSSYSVNFAVVIWLSLEFKSAEILAYSAIASLLPQALIGPFVGVFIDRWNRKKVMIFSDAFVAICAFVMVFILKDGAVNLAWIYLIMALRSVGNAFHSPAMTAVAPLIVPEKQLLRVSGINQMLQSVSSIASPALGALALSYFSISNVLWLDIIGAVAAITSLFFVNIPHIKTETKTHFHILLAELKDGFNVILKNRGLAFLFFFAMMIWFFIIPASIMFPLLTTGYYGGGKWEMSIIEIVWGVGMLVGGSILGIFKVDFSKVILVNAMQLVLGISFVLCGLFPSSWFIGFVVATGLGGIAMAVFSASFTTILQEEVAPNLLGRVFSLYYSIAVLPSIIGLLFAGLISEKIGVPNAFLICGILVIIVGLISFFIPSLMQLGKKENGLTS